MKCVHEKDLSINSSHLQTCVKTFFIENVHLFFNRTTKRNLVKKVLSTKAMHYTGLLRLYSSVLEYHVKKHVTFDDHEKKGHRISVRISEYHTNSLVWIPEEN